MIKYTKLLCVTLFSILLIGYSVNSLCVSQTMHTPQDIILLDLDELRNVIAYYKIRNGSFPYTVNSENLEQNFPALKNLIYTEDYFDKRQKDKIFYDLWGKPYHFYFDMNDDHLVKINNHIFNCEIVIWSDGANQINEFGEGDDIVLCKPLKSKYLND